MGEIVFRNALSQDAEALAELEILCFSDPWSREALTRDLAENPLSRYYVAESEGRVAAYAGVWLVLDQAHIIDVAVHPSLRRQGNGRALVDEVLRRTGEAGVTSWTLEVRRSNEPALALYRSLGFLAAGIRKNYYEHPVEDALILWLGLPEGSALDFREGE